MESRMESGDIEWSLEWSLVISNGVYRSDVCMSGDHLNYNFIRVCMFLSVDS